MNFIHELLDDPQTFDPQPGKIAVLTLGDTPVLALEITTSGKARFIHADGRTYTEDSGNIHFNAATALDTAREILLGELNCALSDIDDEIDDLNDDCIGNSTRLAELYNARIEMRSYAHQLAELVKGGETHA